MVLLQFDPTEPVNLVAQKAQSSVFRYHLGVSLRARSITIGVVLFAVDFDDDTLPIREQEQEVHALPDQGAPIRQLAQGVRIVMEIDLRNDGGQVFLERVAQNFKVEPEEAFLGLRGERDVKALVEGAFRVTGR